MAETQHAMPCGTPFADEKLAIDATAGGIPLTELKYGNTGGTRAQGGKRYATAAIIQVATNSVKYSFTTTPDHADDVAITAAVGDLILLTNRDQIRKFRATQGSGAAVLRVTYLRCPKCGHS